MTTMPRNVRAQFADQVALGCFLLAVGAAFYLAGKAYTLRFPREDMTGSMVWTGIFAAAGIYHFVVAGALFQGRVLAWRIRFGATVGVVFVFLLRLIWALATNSGV